MSNDSTLLSRLSPKKLTNKASSLRPGHNRQSQEIVESTDDESEYHEAASRIGVENDDSNEDEVDSDDEDGEEEPQISPRTRQLGQLEIPKSSSHTLENSSTGPRSSATFPVSVHSRAPTPSFELKRENSYASGKEKKKAVSFLSRFLTTNKKRASTLPLPNETSPVENDRFSIASYPRVEAMSGPVFSQDIDNIEFSPRVPFPTSYTKVKSKNKKNKEFDKLFLAQELRWQSDELEKSETKSSSKPERPDRDAIWALSFSSDGRYLAAGGENKEVKIWSVLGNEEDREAQEIEDDEYPNPAVQMRASVFNSTPVRTYEDPDGAILDLQWSKNHFLLATSQDRTVRLFHPSRDECLCTFKHNAPVLAIAFHPKDDRFFLAGCKDGKLRLWSVPDKRIEFSVTVGDMITAVAFAPDGKTCMAGTVSGSVYLYSTDSLKPMGQIPVRSKKKSRITGIEIRQVATTNDSLKLLVTTTDSRIRLYNLRDKALELKLKAHRNEELTMRASINDDGHYIICPSEDKNVYIWSIADSNLLPSSDRTRDKSIQRPLEHFEANSGKTTCAILAPVDTRILLGQSGDPIFDICNPPPVKLVEREGSIASSTKHNGSGSSANGEVNLKPIPRSATTPVLGSSAFDDGGETPRIGHIGSFDWDIASKSQYHSRAAHDDGQVIITASNTGIIRVFRQDCAYNKRKSTDVARPYLRRAFGSGRTSYSNPPSARPASISSFKGPAAPSIKSANGQRNDGRLGGEITVRGKSRSESVSSHPSRDRIERWRADIEGRASTTSLKRATSVRSAASVSTTQTNSSLSKQNDVRSSLAFARGNSIPRSKNTQMSHSSAMRARAESAGTTADETVATSSRKTSDPESTNEGSDARESLARRSSSYLDPLRFRGGQSFMFWNTSQYETGRSDSVGLAPEEQLVPKISRLSAISRLTDESDEEDDDDEDDFQGGKCPRCGGTEIRTKESRNWTLGKSRSLVCEECGLERRETT